MQDIVLDLHQKLIAIVKSSLSTWWNLHYRTVIKRRRIENKTKTPEKFIHVKRNIDFVMNMRTREICQLHFKHKT
jgi:hypothetical protein